jgi:hypothetical protein
MSLARVKICSLLALALLVGGCGSSHSGTTTISSVPTASPSQSGGIFSKAPTGASGATNSPKPNATSTRPEAKKPLEFKEEGNEPEKMKAREKVTGVPAKHQYPTSVQESFISTCTAAGGSNSACECIIKKLELSPREKGYSLAELLATDVGLRRTTYEAIAKGGPVQVPGPAFQAMRACQAAK